MKSHYILDREGRILEVSGAWDAFAHQNAGDDAVADRVLDRPLWDFVAGDDVRRHLNALFFAARRSGAPIETLYRCDAPWERRLYRLRIEPMRGGALRLEHELLSSERLALNPIAFRKGPGERCAVCGAVHEMDGWTDPFDAPMRHYVYDRWTVCPACRAAGLREIEAAKAA